MKTAAKELREFFTDDCNIPARFGMYNMALLGLPMVILCSSNITVKAMCVIGEGLAAYLMNKEMAKFMEYMMNR